MKRNNKLSDGLNNLLGAREEAKERFAADEDVTTQQEESVKTDTPEPEEAKDEDLISTIEDEELREALKKRRLKKVGRPRKSDKDRVVEGVKYTRFTTIVSREQIAKLKEIGFRETLTLKEILEQIFGDAIAAYERNNGVIVPKNHKGDPSKLFK